MRTVGCGDESYFRPADCKYSIIQELHNQNWFIPIHEVLWNLIIPGVSSDWTNTIHYWIRFSYSSDAATWLYWLIWETACLGEQCPTEQALFENAENIQSQIDSPICVVRSCGSTSHVDNAKHMPNRATTIASLTDARYSFPTDSKRHKRSSA